MPPNSFVMIFCLKSKSRVLTTAVRQSGLFPASRYCISLHPAILPKNNKSLLSGVKTANSSRCEALTINITISIVFVNLHCLPMFYSDIPPGEPKRVIKYPQVSHICHVHHVFCPWVNLNRVAIFISTLVFNNALRPVASHSGLSTANANVISPSIS